MLAYRLFLIAILAFVAGIPFMLTGSTLQAWATKLDFSLISIGALTLIGYPYSIKFLWAPLFDKCRPPLFKGQRRGWLLFTQLLFALCLLLIAWTPLSHCFCLSIILAVLAVIFSASFDTIFDAYRLQILSKEEYALGNAFYITGYRISMLVSGGLALIIADRLGWQLTYTILAGLTILALPITYFAPEPPHTTLHHHRKKQSIWKTISEPWQGLLKINKIYLLLLFIILYKFGESLGTALSTAFLLRYLGYSLTIIGATYKTAGLIATIAGSFLGGFLFMRFGLFRALWWFGWLQALSLLFYLALAMNGQNFTLMISAVSAEALTAGMATTSLMALMMNLCEQEFAATQFALLAAIAPLSRIFTGPLAGWLTIHFGWSNYFIISFITCLPALFLLWFIRRLPLFRIAKK